MLINLTVQSINYRDIVILDENKRVSARMRSQLFEDSDLRNAITNLDPKLTGTTSLTFGRRTYGVLESLETIQNLISVGLAKQSESDSNIELLDGVSASITFENEIGDDSSDFSLDVSCRASGDNVDYTVTNITKSGFDIVAAADCLMSYIAIKH